MKQKMIIGLVILAALCAAVAGCQGTSAQRTAFNVSQTVVTSVGSARDAWAAYYVHQRQVLTGDTAALAKLEAKRAQVNAAWFHYTQAATTAILAQEAGFANTNGVPAQVGAALTAASQPFIELVTGLIK